jgi:hypothetical protein
MVKKNIIFISTILIEFDKSIVLKGNGRNHCYLGIYPPPPKKKCLCYSENVDEKVSNTLHTFLKVLQIRFRYWSNDLQKL